MKRFVLIVFSMLLTIGLLAPSGIAAQPGEKVEQMLGSIARKVIMEKPDEPGNEEAFFSWNGYSIEPIKYKIYRSSNSDPDLYVYFRVINQTDSTLDLYFNNVEVDGTSVTSTGIYDIEPGTDTGEDSETRILIFAKRDAIEDGSEAILSAGSVTADLVLKLSGEEVYSKYVEIDLLPLESEIKIEEPKQEPESKSEPETQASTKPAADYRTLFPGSSGEDVRKLQEQLIALGYLNDIADGQYGTNTANAVKAFNEANGLSSGDVATYSMQVLLFSEDVESAPHNEDWIPLQIGDEFYYDPVLGVNTFFFKVQVTNTSPDRAIRGYEVSLYMTNVWGEKLDGGVIYTQTMTQRVEPGETLYCANFNLGNWYSVDSVWVGISKIVFDDGEIREPDTVDYYECVIPSRIN